MTKQELHDSVKANKDLTKDDFVSVYGHCNTVERGGETVCCADILARVYNKSVTITGDNYSFVDK